MSLTQDLEIDASPVSVVIQCAHCPGWADIVRTEEAADRVALAHAQGGAHDRATAQRMADTIQARIRGRVA